MLNSLWKRRAASLYIGSDVFDTVLRRFSFDVGNVFPISDAHLRVHFNDNTHYCICERYSMGFEKAVSLELKSCLFVSVPVQHTQVGITSSDLDAFDVADSACTNCLSTVASALFPRQQGVWEPDVDVALRKLVSDKIVIRNLIAGDVQKAAPGCSLLGWILYA